MYRGEFNECMKDEKTLRAKLEGLTDNMMFVPSSCRRAAEPQQR